MRVALRLGLPRRLGGAGGSVSVCGGGVAWIRAALVPLRCSASAWRADLDGVRGERGQRDRGQAPEQEAADALEQATAQPFLDVRTAVLNDTLEDAFRHRYPGFRPANDDQAFQTAA